MRLSVLSRVVVFLFGLCFWREVKENRIFHRGRVFFSCFDFFFVSKKLKFSFLRLLFLSGVGGGARWRVGLVKVSSAPFSPSLLLLSPTLTSTEARTVSHCRACDAGKEGLRRTGEGGWKRHEKKKKETRWRRRRRVIFLEGSRARQRVSLCSTCSLSRQWRHVSRRS